MGDEYLNGSGYAGVGLVTIELHAGDNEHSITITPLPKDLSPPILTSFIDRAGVHVRLFQQKCWPVQIEYSTDLRTWKFYADAFYNREFPPLDVSQNVFYRAVRAP